MFNILKLKTFFKNRLFSRNIDPSIPLTYLSQCKFDEETGNLVPYIHFNHFFSDFCSFLDPDCPIFQIGYILEKAEPNNEERKKILLKVKMKIKEIILVIIILGFLGRSD